MVNNVIEAARQAAAWLHRFADKLEAGDLPDAIRARLQAEVWLDRANWPEVQDDAPKHRLLRTEPPLTDLPHDGNDNAARR